MKEDIEFTESGNEAVLKFVSGDPLTAQEAVALAGVDLDIWSIESHRVNMWQMGRKDREVALSFDEGVASGYVKDTGEIKKTYLYQIEVKLTRKQRLSVELVLSPVQIKNHQRPIKGAVKKPKGSTSIIFVTDPHFGFSTKPFEKPEPYHDRLFLSNLLAIARRVEPDYFVWGGDILDLAEFSRWPKKPEVVFNTQIAAIEAAWLLNQFALVSQRPMVILEGNHDLRLPASMVQHLSSAYELRPVHDLAGESLMSVPRLLGFENRDDILWVAGYPNNFYQIGEVYFEHGSVAKSGPGATAAALAKSRIHNTIFGHIHRHEKVRVRREDGRVTTMASPGCACRWQYVPGASRFSDWTQGAFLITLQEGKLMSIEDINHVQEETYFRGERFVGRDYSVGMLNEIPAPFKEAF